MIRKVSPGLDAAAAEALVFDSEEDDSEEEVEGGVFGQGG
jgi:hypothetical protein